MTPDQWCQVTAVFHGALARDAAARETFLHHACGADAVLRAEVERLLAAHDEAGQFGDGPLAGVSSISSLEDASDAVSAVSPPEASGRTTARRHPFLTIVWLAAAATLGVFVYAAWVLVTSGGASTAFGWNEQPRGDGWFITGVEASGPAARALHAGDRIVALDGAPPIAVVGTAIHRRHLASGDTYVLTIDRAGDERALRLAVADGPTMLVTRLVYFFTSMLWCLVGLWIGAARPENPVARLALAVSVCAGLLFLTLGVLDLPPLWGPLHVVLGYHFFARFPTGDVVRGVWRAALWALYVGGIVAVASGLAFEGLVLLRGMNGAAPYDALMQVRDVLGLVGFAGAIAAMLAVIPRNYWRLTTADQRRRVQWVIYAAVIGLAPEVWYAGVAIFETFVGPASVSRLTLVANIAPVAIPLSVAYVVVKHRVFDIRVAVRRTVQYLLARRVLQTAIVLPIAALAYTVGTHRHLTIAELVGDTRGYLFWLGATGVALRFRRPIELALDRRFFREQHDREQLLLGMLDEIGRVESIAELSRVVSERLESALHPARTHVWYRDPDELALASSSNPLLTPPDVPSGASWLAWLEHRGATAAFPVPADAGLAPHEVRWFTARGITLIVPVDDSTGRLVGAFLLGAKKSEEPYSAADRQLLSAIAKQAGVVRENLRLRARVGEDARVRREVLARLDGQFPDLLKECPACGACYDGAFERCPADDQPLTLSLPVARTVDGKYRLDQLLGRGGMGAVYEAHDLRLDRAVAVKILSGRAFGQQAALRRFHREARAAARVNHPNIVSLYDYGALAGEGAYLVMERVHGITLRAEIARRTALPAQEAAEWFDPLLDGLAMAHEAGLIHRDLKPENVMGQRTVSGALSVKVLDLGLVKFRVGESPTPATGTVTAEGVVMGTPGYMSPEQLFGRDVDQRTDIFAVGVMIVETLTGERPFAGDPYGAVRLAPSQEQYRLPGSSPEARALSGLLQRCLAADPYARLASAAALRSELIPLLRACPPLPGATADPAQS